MVKRQNSVFFSVNTMTLVIIEYISHYRVGLTIDVQTSGIF